MLLKGPATIGFLLILFQTLSSVAQVPIGAWREHLPYRTGVQVASTKNKIYCATPYSLIVFDPAENSVEKLSKVNGLSEIGISAIGSDESSGSLAIAYNNSNVDMLIDNQIINISDIKRKNLNVDKTIYNIGFSQQLVYLSTALGVIVINPEKREVKDTYVIGNGGGYTRVTGVAVNGPYIYAATPEGLKRAVLAAVNLSDYRQWELISGTGVFPSGACSDVFAIGTSVFAEISDSLWVSNGQGWKSFYADGYEIRHARVSAGKIFVSERKGATNRLIILNPDGTVNQTINTLNGIINPTDGISFNNGIYLSDSLRGLVQVSGTSTQAFSPDGPGSITDGEMIVVKNTLWVAPGSVNQQWEKINRKEGIAEFWQEKWRTVDQGINPVLANVSDIITVAADPLHGTIWAGSFGDGLLSLKTDNTVTLFKQNSFIKPSENSPGRYAVAGLAFDLNNNLWISNYGAANSLIVKKPDGSTSSFVIPGSTFDFAFSKILVDDQNLKWIISPKANGLFCFDSGASIDNTGDDKWKHFTTGIGNGNLPDNNVLSTAVDKSGFIWVGTSKGIGIIQCNGTVFSNQVCDAILPIVQQDNFAGYLFSNEQVQAIAVDGADRKWIGTRNGVWLVSKYGDKTIYHFTAANSPLLDDNVKNLVIDPGSGEVFFETIKGICSFRADATTVAATGNNVIVFPNPVPPDFTGNIAIKGLKDNALFKIVEMNGRLVYQGRSNGSTASWNGLNYQGQRVSAGVYLVLVRADNGKDQVSTKIVIIR